MYDLRTLFFFQDDETALHIAAYHGHVDVVKVLTAGKDRLLINARDEVSTYNVMNELILDKYWR